MSANFPTGKLFLVAFCCCVLFLPCRAHAETVTLQLKWSHQFQFAGYYAAIEQGYYQEEGLDVILREGRADIDPIQEVVSGRADFTVNNTSLLVERDNGAPAKVIAAIFQHSPQVLITRKDAGFVTPHDLQGKKIMLNPEQSTDILAMLASEGVDLQQIDFLPHTWQINDLLAGRVDAMSAYSTTEPYIFQQLGVPINIINPINYGVDYYGDCLIASESLLKTRPELARRFVRASLKGWQYALSHQEELIDLIISKYNPRLSREQLAFEAAEIHKVILPEYVELGHINPGRWDKIAETHQKLGLLSENFSVKNLLHDPDNERKRISQLLITPLLALTAILALFVLLFAGFNKKLKRIVKERTEKLEEKIGQLKEKEETIRRLAYQDILTNLPNRLLLIERLNASTILEQASDRHFALAFLDLDDFKRINDAMGHSAGDELLKVIADRLRQCLLGVGFVYRLGGDEFILLLPEVNSRSRMRKIMACCITAVKSPWHYKGCNFHLSASIGVARFPEDGKDADALIKAADIAMYEAKRLGKSRYEFFNEALYAASLGKLALESELHQAIANSEFVLHYQPQFDCNANIVGVEALIRWNHPTKGLLYPGAFIPLAEETGLIIPIGDWVLRSACRQCMAWQNAGVGALRVSVNISVIQLHQHDLLGKIRNILAETGLPPHLLELEITETVAVTHAELVFSVMNSLLNMGVRLALDDFGIGYSSLMYLKSFPVDVLKIDRAFIQDLAINAANKAIIRTIFSLAENLGIGVIAEGVETEEQYNCLKSMARPVMQGYLFSPPVPAEDMEAFFQNRKNR